MFVIGGKSLERQIVQLVDRIQAGADDKLTKIKDYLDLSKEVNRLRDAITLLTIEKSTIEEKHARREREIEHKLGLEKQRQEQELKLAIREASLKAKEENLSNERGLFEKEMKFTRDRMTDEVGYLKNMVAQVLERLPDARIISENITTTTKSKPK